MTAKLSLLNRAKREINMAFIMSAVMFLTAYNWVCDQLKRLSRFYSEYNQCILERVYVIEDDGEMKDITKEFEKMNSTNPMVGVARGRMEVRYRLNGHKYRDVATRLVMFPPPRYALKGHAISTAILEDKDGDTEDVTERVRKYHGPNNWFPTELQASWMFPRWTNYVMDSQKLRITYFECPMDLYSRFRRRVCKFLTGIDNDEQKQEVVYNMTDHLCQL